MRMLWRWTRTHSSAPASRSALFNGEPFVREVDVWVVPRTSSSVLDRGRGDPGQHDDGLVPATVQLLTGLQRNAVEHRPPLSFLIGPRVETPVANDLRGLIG